jgi:S1-C subfamily serine protease
MYRYAWAIGTAVLLAWSAGAGRGQEPPRLADALALQDAMAAAIKKAEPSIACILVARSDAVSTQDLANPEHVPESYGSGVVINDKGLVLTNLHVVRDATAIYVRLPGDKGGKAAIRAGDPRSDLAVLQLQLEPTALPVKALKFGDGSAVRKGDFVLSLAHPFAAGFRDGSPSASWGIISNIRRRAPGKATEEANYKTLHQFGTLLQTDARLNLGCSGGAVIDLKGNLVGLTTALAAISGGETPGGFAVPMDAGMRRIIDVLARGEEVEYGFLGVSFSKDKERRPGQPGEGVAIDQVIPGSPAAMAGLRRFDYIRSVNGVAVREPDDLFVALGTVLAGSEARLEVAHSPRGPGEAVSVKLSKFYVPGKVIATRRPEPVGGLRVDYTSILFLRPGGQQIYGSRIPEGVMIREVEPGSPADAARLQESKVIVRVNGRKVTTPDEFYREMQDARGPVELMVVTGDREEPVKMAIR